MVDGLILETTFLVDLEREAHACETGPAHDFLNRHSEAPLNITTITAGELACGPGVGEREGWQKLVDRFPVLGIDADASWAYGETFRYLKAQGLLIGTNDLWIAAIALSRGLPVVTRNQKYFRRVPGLKVLDYRD